MKNNTKTRELAEQIQAKTGESLVKINFDANQYVQTGLCQSVEEAFAYMLRLVSEDV